MHIDRATYQLLVTKLDMNHISLKEAKQFVKRYGIKPQGRTKEQFLKALFAEVSRTTTTLKESGSGKGIWTSIRSTTTTLNEEGQTDNPQTIGNELLKTIARRVVARVDDSGQFDCRFSMWYEPNSD